MTTAGMCNGTPDWQLDLMYETESGVLWENQCKPTDETTLKKAADSLFLAIEDLDRSCDLVNEACEWLVDTAEGDRISSVLQDMEKLLKDIRGMQSKWAKGESK